VIGDRLHLQIVGDDAAVETTVLAKESDHLVGHRRGSGGVERIEDDVRRHHRGHLRIGEGAEGNQLDLLQSTDIDSAGLGELLAGLGRGAVQAHGGARVSELAGGAREAGIEVVTPAGRRAGIVTLRPPDVRATSERMRDARVIHSVREGTIRLAPHCYTTTAEIALALEALAG
jgi:hypothetical protein